METILLALILIPLLALTLVEKFQLKNLRKKFKNTIDTAQAFIDNDPRVIKVNLFTYKTQNGMPDGPVASDKDGKYIPVLIAQDFELKIPIHVVFEDKHIRPPFIEHNGILWMFHTVAQLDGRINVFVMFAGSPNPEKSPICADPTQHTEHDFEDLPMEDVEPIQTPTPLEVVNDEEE